MKGRHELLCIPMVLIHKLAPPPIPKCSASYGG